MDLPSMILYVLQFSTAPVSVNDIAQRISADFEETVTPDEVSDTLSSLLSRNEVSFEDGLFSLRPQLSDSKGATALAQIQLNPMALRQILVDSFDECARSRLLDELVSHGAVDMSFAYEFQRLHMRQCSTCRENCPDLDARFLERDTGLLSEISSLLRSFQLWPEKGAVDRAAGYVFLEEYGVRSTDADSDPFDDPQFYAVRDHLTEVVNWRAVLLGARIGHTLKSYSRTHEAADDLWLDFRKGLGDAQTAAWVRSLSKAQFFRLLLAEECFDVVEDNEGIATTQLQELLAELDRVGPGYPARAFSSKYEQLFNLCNDEAGRIKGGQLLIKLMERAMLRATREDTPAPRQHNEQLAEIGAILTELKDRIDSANAVQIPIIDLLERVLKHLGEPALAAVEESLRQTLGGTYSLLCPEAQACLVTAEQLSQFRELADPSVVVVAIAKAFESQLEMTFLRPLCEYLQKKGFSRYPTAAEPRRSLLIGGRINRKLMLGDIARLLESGEQELEQFASTRGIGLATLVKTIREVAEKAGEAKHTNAFSLFAAKRLKDRWLKGEPFGNSIFMSLGLAVKGEASS
jgi:hypothetical protein